MFRPLSSPSSLKRQIDRLIACHGRPHGIEDARGQLGHLADAAQKKGQISLLGMPASELPYAVLAPLGCVDFSQWSEQDREQARWSMGEARSRLGVIAHLVAAGTGVILTWRGQDVAALVGVVEESSDPAAFPGGQMLANAQP